MRRWTRGCARPCLFRRTRSLRSTSLAAVEMIGRAASEVSLRERCATSGHSTQFQLVDPVD